MKLPSKKIAAALTLLSTLSVCNTHAANKSIIYFNDIDTPSDTVGSLPGILKFGQSSVIPAINRHENETQPSLVGRRDTLVLFKPKIKVSEDKPMFVFVKDKVGNTLFTRRMRTPKQIPLHINRRHFLVPGKIDKVVRKKEELRSLSFQRESNDEWASSPEFVKMLIENPVTKIVIDDKNWVPRIVLPRTKKVGTAKVIVVNNSKKSIVIKYSHYAPSYTVTKEMGPIVANAYNSFWHLADKTFVNVRFGEYWSAKVPKQFVEQGMSVTFVQGSKQSEFNEVPMIGEPVLWINTVAIGMLTEPREIYELTQDKSLQKQYFSLNPATRLVVNEYEPVHLKEVMMPWGDLYKTASPDLGGVHTGDMRNKIGKQLISKSINHANLGMNSTDPLDTIAISNQHTAHTSIGMYANGKRLHAASGGQGMITLGNTVGNEFSHEMGHSLGTGHFTGGVWGHKHRGAHQVNSGWGWDADKNQFITNFNLRHARMTNCFMGECNKPFMGMLTYNKDPMAGGSPVSRLGNNYVLPTPFAQRKMQQVFSKQFSLNSKSPTGFTKYNPETKLEEPYTPLLPKPMTHFEGTQVDLDGDKLGEIINKYDFVKVKIDVDALNARASDELSQEDSDTEESNVESAEAEQAMVLTTKDSISIALAEIRSETETEEYVTSDGIPIVRLSLPEATKHNKLRSIEILESPDYKVIVKIPDQHDIVIAPTDRGRNRYIYSDGEGWQHKWSISEVLEGRVPIFKNAKVATVYGYYDPEMKLPSYIYGRPLFGASGNLFTHQNHRFKNDNQSCRLEVTLASGAVSQHALHNRRLRGTSQGRDDYMNKFHVNFPQSNPPVKAAVFCKGQKLTETKLEQRDKSIKLKVNYTGVTPAQQEMFTRRQIYRKAR